MTVDHYTVLELPRTATADDVKRAFRALAMKYHPDRNKLPAAEEKFKQITAANEVLSDPEKRARYDRTGSAAATVIVSRAASYTIESCAATGDVADVYQACSSKGATVALKVARNPADTDLMAREWDALKTLHPPGTTDSSARCYFPPAIETFKVDDGVHRRRQVNVTSWLTDYRPLTEVAEAYENGLAIEHATWIFNRILEALHFAHSAGIVHGAVLPQHVMVYTGASDVDPLNHGARLVGWTFSTKIGGKVPAIVSGDRVMYAPEILAKRTVTAATDIFMAARCVQRMVGASTRIPTYFRNFMRGCALDSQSARPQSALDLHQEFKEHMARHYGPKKYIKFTMPYAARGAK